MDIISLVIATVGLIALAYVVHGYHNLINVMAMKPSKDSEIAWKMQSK